jgi:hypothetical protein
MKERNTKRLKLGNKNSSEENVFAAKFNPLCKKKTFDSWKHDKFLF